jgi:hypothetical protein
VLLLTLLLSVPEPSTQPVDGLLLRNVQIADTNGTRHVDAVVIRGDRIESVGDAPDDWSGLLVMDAQGRTLAPGIIDLHVHLSLIPSGWHLQPDAQETRDLWTQHLAAYLRCGVTTVLDTGITAPDAHAMLELADRVPAPDIHLLGPLVSPDQGYVNAVLPDFPPAASAQDVRDQLDAFADLDTHGVKITVESGMLRPVWPLYPPDVVQALQDSGRPLYAHAISDQEATQALDWGATGLVHPPSKPSAELVQRLVDEQIPVTTTLGVFDSMLWGVQPERFDHPMIGVVPQVELDAALDTDWRKESARTVADHVLPTAPGPVRGLIGRSFQNERMLQGQVDAALEGVLALYEAGVPLSMGSDSGNWPVFLYQFHGLSSQLELELLTQAGIPPHAVMDMATVNPATVLGLQDDRGQVAPGMRADLLLLDGNPLEDPTAWSRIQWILAEGAPVAPL